MREHARHPFAEWLLSLPRHVKVAVLAATDAFSVFVAAWIVFALVNHNAATLAFPAPPALFVALVALTVLIAAALDLYRSILRYSGTWVAFTAAKAAGAVVIGTGAILTVLRQPVDYAALLLLWPVLIVAQAGSRLLARRLLGQGRRRHRERVAIYGAGSAGAELAAAMKFSGQYHPVAFFDDNPEVQGRAVDGTRVYAPEAIPDIAARLGVKRVVLAMPSIPARRKREIIERLGQHALRVQTLPSLSNLLGGQVDLNQLRDISVEELLWREPVAPMAELLDHDVRGRNVAVTGGGGSIGSELARQILDLGPQRLVIVESSEYALYRIEQKLEAHNAGLARPVALDFVLGTVCDGRAMTDVFRRHGIDTVYHAAAYKHVPLVERNPVDGVFNNAIGTYRTAQAALAARVRKFVLVSTDKAVRPTNVMGASKRLAELVLQGLSSSGESDTVFTMVRFGNVLNSAGSVVPLFRRQIAAGGPITLTHRDIVRYFMTIPEAVSLVLQAGALARGGEVFVLDMGEPVRIYDLAVKLIHLNGYTVKNADNPDGDIAIEITGLRPGEKLYEELLIGENAQATPHPRIMKAKEQSQDWSSLQAILHGIELAVAARDDQRVVQLLCDAVPEYSPWKGRAPRMDVTEAQAEPGIRSQMPANIN